MKILVLGSGGREHAITWSLSKSKNVSEIFVSPGNAGTFGSKSKNIDLGNDFARIASFCKQENVDLVVVGPEQPLVDGISDYLKREGIACFGPSKAAAQLEGSKAFSKDFMKKNDIPTAKYESFREFKLASDYLSRINHKVVIKASGLAAGKGVLLPNTKQEALDALKQIMVEKVFGNAGDEVVIEEFLEGEECSVLAFCDGYTVVPMIPSQDHKRAYDGDHGPNTGGMGAYAPTPVVNDEIMKIITNDILQKAVNGMRKQGTPYIGILFAGIMITEEGPKTLEFNCRMGDPETQVVLPLLSDDSDLAEIMMSCVNGYLDSVTVNFSKQFSATVVAASSGYPGNYEKGKSIEIIPVENAIVFHAGTAIKNNTVQTSGGRVLCTTAIGATISDALSKAYQCLQNIKFEGMQYRTDIGHRALKYQTKKEVTYLNAGVSIDRGNELVETIKGFVRNTRRPGSDAVIGGFGGLFDLKSAGYTEDPILVSSTDGVGTKLKIAHIMNKHDTIGIDLVAMNVNDLIVQGAEPMFFLDYFACSKLDVPVACDVVKGIAKGCEIAGCALIGGETAEMPGMYQQGDYDLAGFTVGAVERAKILPVMDQIVEGDVVLGIPSSGVHSNGYSLVRHLMSIHGIDYYSPCPFESNKTVGEALLTPTRIYIKQMLPIIRQGCVKAMAHITGGGLLENIPRVLPDNLGVLLDAKKWPLLPVFKWLKRLGNMKDLEISRTFNCGIGMIIVVGKDQVETAKKMLKEANEEVFEIGNVASLEESKNMHYKVKILNTQESW